jgi:hypothetical protein
MSEEKKSGAERTQPATRNEEWSDDRVKAFLNLQPPEGVAADYHILVKAYRGMLPEHFERFLHFFEQAGLDVNAKIKNGSTFLDHLYQHRCAEPYIALMRSHGAVSGTESQDVR